MLLTFRLELLETSVQSEYKLVGFLPAQYGYASHVEGYEKVQSSGMAVMDFKSYQLVLDKI